MDAFAYLSQLVFVVGVLLAREHDMISPMAKLLETKDSDPILLSFVAAAAAALCMQAECRQQMVAKGIVHHLSEVIQKDDIKVLRNATAALKSLSQYADSRAQMLVPGDCSMSAVAALVRLCSNSSLGTHMGSNGGSVAEGRDAVTIAQVIRI